LGLPPTAPTFTIRKTYYALAKKYHPDKHPGEAHSGEVFKQLSEAYSTLSNPKKRYLYDIQLELSHDPVSEPFHFTDDELDILYAYYQKITRSIEVRFLVLLYQSLPNQNSDHLKQSMSLHLQQLSGVFQRPYTHTMVHQPNLKTIDCRQLTEDFSIHLQRDFQEVYLNRCKEVKIFLTDKTHHLFITHSDYALTFHNGTHRITIHIATHIDEPYVVNGYDIHYKLPINLYQYFFNPYVSIQFPRFTLKHDPRDTNVVIITNQGLHNPLLNKRGTLFIHPTLLHFLNMDISHLHKELLYTLLTPP
jgi:curved DNA-binding protein CbpA